MRYDDRLATALRLTPAWPSVARIQYRQLLDLLGTSPADARGTLLDEAYLRLADLATRIPPAERAAMLDQPGQRLRSPRLLATLADGHSQVAAAAIRAAQLSQGQWLDVIPALPLHARGLLHQRGDMGEAAQRLLARLGVGAPALASPADQADSSTDTPPVCTPQAGTPQSGSPTQASGAGPDVAAMAKHAPATTRLAAESHGLSAPASTAPVVAAVPFLPTSNLPRSDSPPAHEPVAFGPILPTPANDTMKHDATDGQSAPDNIGALVRRIEAFRRARVGDTPGQSEEANSAPPAPPAPLQAFDFASDAQGRVVWAQPAAAPMIMGHALGQSTDLAPLIAQHQPLRAVQVNLDGAPAIAGCWQVDAIPRFDPLGGRYVGHLGRFRRALPVANPAAPTPDSEADRLRQLLHELRTPVTAIQGFAEIIQQQLFGPAPHEYRALAAVIAADSARMLAGFEELDRYARLGSGTMDLPQGSSDLAACLAAVVGRLEPQEHDAAPRFRLSLPAGVALPAVALPPIEAERLCWRLLAVLAGNAAAGETLDVALTAEAGQLSIALQLPASLAGLDDAALFHAAAPPMAPGSDASMFGTGFALRLASVEASAAAGALRRDGIGLRLTLPSAAEIMANPQVSTQNSPVLPQSNTHSSDGVAAR